MSSTDIVVGVDGSEPSRGAVRWAAAEAERRGAALRVVAAGTWPSYSARFGGAEELREVARAQQETVVAEAVAEVRALVPGVEVTGSVEFGEPAVVLVDAGRSAAVVVVGNRGHGGFGSLLLGSVSQRVATHASTPVVVVRGRGDAADGPVVVGVDDSPSAHRAVGIGFEEAQRRGCQLVAVRAYTVPVPPRGGDAPPLKYDPEVLRSAAGQELDATIARWRDKFPDVAVESLVGVGSAARILVDVSRTAGLVVVGSRGHGSLVGTLLGSVGLQLLHHAECPVMIVHLPPAR